MNATAAIRNALKDIMDAGDANACQIFKGWSESTNRVGWHYRRFGRSEATYLGKSVAEALETVGEMAAYSREWEA